jgi:hypothetical protein
MAGSIFTVSGSLDKTPVALSMQTVRHTNSKNNFFIESSNLKVDKEILTFLTQPSCQYALHIHKE